MSKLDEIFECTRCGYCCKGETTVSLDEDDQRRMCDALSMARDKVAEQYWRVTGDVVQMKVTDGHCVFYEDGCSVHGGRPWRCAEWPLHPSILSDINNFKTIRESCPGIRRDVSYEQFCSVLSGILAEAGRAKC